METLTAAFRSRSEMEQAADALRKQGVIHLMMCPNGAGSDHAYPEWAGDSFQSGLSGGQDEGLLQLLVESSRRRQAEDTISRFGGIL
ncbi:hypothetical protein P9314_07605 [Paenibacillus validus]|uniref:Uncharacterized protein n=1 Tax=Paenibacillus validus TaxID=44253 RepID=A0A7X2ZDA5_9BACL|nr:MULTISPECIES: hypothetical protein [Paenibacillus]MED4600569.1 hypothetical protein [Paenibacillus validus]MED4605578.1 hypothetical protein [Paenibacillus validus]MUG72823.1 hypothetical protein [Paenibacillus validus]